ncbi:hypothetical protein IFM89_020786 [Coptis chinensis]|uniref:GTD-binding domain-containing protein n=1 Tax=Coptis chinensis TaxID=261450 RepID=A0A835HXC4_9MAGN|nr:hypothetical protein IFM89_020786 [Coptis chinensis]
MIRLLQPVGPEAAVLNVDLLATVEKKRVHLHDGLKKSREKICRELSYSLGGCQSSDPLSHPVYSELKITSDSESEVPFCDDDDDRDSLVHSQDNLKEDTKDQSVQLGLCTAHTDVLTLSGSLTSEEQVHEVFVPEPSPLVPQAQHDLEQLTMKDSTRVSEDLKLWLSQISSPRGLDLPFSDLSPRPHVQREYLKTSDPSCSIGLQILQKRISLERNESGFESLDGSIVSEIEGESLVDRLKRQVEYDRKSMNSLYKELEEERNASAVAANQALAMITRLQEEKATLQMDALQYLRMMEEQAEYDVDALQKANELLAEKEQKGQDLEAELELYRGRISCEAMVEKVQVPTCDSKGGRRMEHLDVSRLIHTINTPCNTPREHSQCTRRPDKTDVVNGNTHTRITTASLVGFEDERSYILQCLEKLEKKLRLFSNNGLHFPIDGNFIKEETAVNHLGRSEGNSQREEDSFPEQNDSSAHPPDQEKHMTTAHQNLTNDKYSPDCEWEDIETHIVALEHEFFYLNERLKALEADRNILEHTINSLQTGDGIHFIQEIAQDLRELRKVGIRRDQTIV